MCLIPASAYMNTYLGWTDLHGPYYVTAQSMKSAALGTSYGIRCNDTCIEWLQHIELVRLVTDHYTETLKRLARPCCTSDFEA